MTLESKGNDILFVSSAEYKVGRLRTTTRGTRTTYTTGGITTTDIQLPDRVERVRTGTRLDALGRASANVVSNLQPRLDSSHAILAVIENDLQNLQNSHVPQGDRLAALRRSRQQVIDRIAEIDRAITIAREAVAAGTVTKYEERTIAGGTRQVQTVAPTTVQVTSLCRIRIPIIA